MLGSGTEQKGSKFGSEARGRLLSLSAFNFYRLLSLSAFNFYRFLSLSAFNFYRLLSWIVLRSSMAFTGFFLEKAGRR